MLKHFLIASPMIWACAMPAAVTAQNAPSEPSGELNTESYDAAYFTQYAPRTAEDMISQVPGFSVEGRDDSRGLGQGGANVLLNGARLTGKSDAQDQLARISAVNVIRIEILDGASLDIPGLSGRIANIVTQSTGLTGVWNWEPQWRRDEGINLGRGAVSISSERGALAYTLNAEIDNRRSTDKGFGRYTNGNDQLLQNFDEELEEEDDDYTIGADLTWTRANGHIATLTTQLNYAERSDLETSDRSRADGAPSGTALQAEDIFTRDQEETEFEIGADYTFPFLFGQLKLIANWRDEQGPSQSRSSFTQDSVLTRFRLSDSDDEEGERIVRGEFNWQSEAGSDFQLSTEGAFNFLSNDETTTDIAGIETRRDDRVEELRSEVNLTYGRTLTRKLDMQSSIGVEYSELTQSDGLSDAKDFVRDFVRPKGFVNLAYAVNDSLTLRSRIEREVGQLDFGDFLDSVDLQNDLDTASNPDLVPEQAWLGNIQLDKDFGQGNRFIAKVYGAVVEDVIDFIPIGDTQEGIGNLDDTAFRWGVELESSIRGERWGYDGMQADLELALRETQLTDPLTGENRPFSNSQEYDWSVNVRHDIPSTDWAYGFGLSQRQNHRVFRLGRTVLSSTTDPRTWVFIEHKDVMGMTVQARVLNLVDEADTREQIDYVGRRGFSDIDTREFTQLGGGLFFRIILSGTF